MHAQCSCRWLLARNHAWSGDARVPPYYCCGWLYRIGLHHCFNSKLLYLRQTAAVYSRMYACCQLFLTTRSIAMVLLDASARPYTAAVQPLVSELQERAVNSSSDTGCKAQQKGLRCTSMLCSADLHRLPSKTWHAMHALYLMSSQVMRSSEAQCRP